MKNSLLFGISLLYSSYFMAQNNNANQVSLQPASSVNLPYSYGFETADLE